MPRGALKRGRHERAAKPRHNGASQDRLGHAPFATKKTPIYRRAHRQQLGCGRSKTGGKSRDNDTPPDSLKSRPSRDLKGLLANEWVVRGLALGMTCI